MVPFAIIIAALCLTVTAARAEAPAATDDPFTPYVAAPPPTGDAKSTIISGILMIVNGVIMSEADRRHQQCATFVTGLQQNGFPIFRQVCRLPERRE